MHKSGMPTAEFRSRNTENQPWKGGIGFLLFVCPLKMNTSRQKLEWLLDALLKVDTRSTQDEDANLKTPSAR